MSHVILGQSIHLIDMPKLTRYTHNSCIQVATSIHPVVHIHERNKQINKENPVLIFVLYLRLIFFEQKIQKFPTSWSHRVERNVEKKPEKGKGGEGGAVLSP